MDVAKSFEPSLLLSEWIEVEVSRDFKVLVEFIMVYRLSPFSELHGLFHWILTVVPLHTADRSGESSRLRTSLQNLHPMSCWYKSEARSQHGPLTVSDARSEEESSDSGETVMEEQADPHSGADPRGTGRLESSVCET